MPIDGYGRCINYLRLSLTDRCNFRCVYCMPGEGLRFLPEAELLTPVEYELVVRAALRAGFRKFRLTGGEPTLREDLVEIVERIARLDGVHDLAMTTNGSLLDGWAEELARAGLKRVNIHLDSPEPERLERVMRRGRLESILSGIEAAERAGLVPIKINTVVARGYNDTEVADLARLTLDRDWQVRFIELMPLGEGSCGRLARTHFVSNVVTRHRIEAELGALAPLTNADPSDESVNFRAPGASGVIGFISPVSAPYCRTCNRMRLTPEGKFHLCLLNGEELDVRRVIRGGRGVAEVQRVLQQAVALKPTGHALSEPPVGGGAGRDSIPVTIPAREAIVPPRERVATGPSASHCEMYQIGG